MKRAVWALPPGAQQVYAEQEMTRQSGSGGPETIGANPGWRRRQPSQPIHLRVGGFQVS